MTCHCLNCKSWLRNTDDPVVGVCQTPLLAPVKEVQQTEYRFQFEHCERYSQGDDRAPWHEYGRYQLRTNNDDKVVDPARIKAERLTRGWTLTDAGKFFGVSYSTIRNWERGEKIQTDKRSEVLAFVEGRI